MEQAVRLMKDEEKKLETISFLVGYDDYNYFSRVFRKKVGVSPREYRNNMYKSCQKCATKKSKYVLTEQSQSMF